MALLIAAYRCMCGIRLSSRPLTEKKGFLAFSSVQSTLHSVHWLVYNVVVLESVYVLYSSVPKYSKPYDPCVSIRT